MKPLPDNNGLLVLITGNAGSGKDTIMKAVQDLWPLAGPKLHVPRRFVTRPAHPAEPHIPVSENRFRRMKHQKAFSLDWEAHDLQYGVPAKIDKWLACGDLVLVNVSRTVISSARIRYPFVRVVFLQVPLSVTRDRLNSRGREAADSDGYFSRLERARSLQSEPDADLIIDNTGSIDAAAQQLTDELISVITRIDRQRRHHV